MSEILQTDYLEGLLEWGVQDSFCKKEVVESLIRELLRERRRAFDAESKLNKTMSDIELRRHRKSLSSSSPSYKDGVKYQAPDSRQTGPDGFPINIV